MPIFSELWKVDLGPFGNRLFLCSYYHMYCSSCHCSCRVSSKILQLAVATVVLCCRRHDSSQPEESECVVFTKKALFYIVLTKVGHFVAAVTSCWKIGYSTKENTIHVTSPESNKIPIVKLFLSSSCCANLSSHIHDINHAVFFFFSFQFYHFNSFSGFTGKLLKWLNINQQLFFRRCGLCLKE